MILFCFFSLLLALIEVDFALVTLTWLLSNFIHTDFYVDLLLLLLILIHVFMPCDPLLGVLDWTSFPLKKLNI